MYNYREKLDYYNFENNNYNQPMFTENVNANQLLDPYNGFLKGNMFPSLYNSYKESKPFNIKSNTEQSEMLKILDSLCFVLIEINLYLDVYPNDRDMIQKYNQYRVQTNQLMKEYESKYGPLLTNSDALNVYPWAWNNKPWPWEN